MIDVIRAVLNTIAVLAIEYQLEIYREQGLPPAGRIRIEM